jgi:chemotaxis protein methyltransferase CheR
MSDNATISLTEKEFSLFREMIYKEAGIALGSSKQQLVESRLSKRLRNHNLTSFTQYYKYLNENDRNGDERLKMINALTTNKTDFFREQHHFDYLKSTLFPMLEQKARETGERKIRIWSAACSTGEEPYTLAMTVLDHFGPTSFHGWDIRILASDVDTDVLNHAQKGVYAADRVSDVPRDILKRHFLKTSKDPEAPVQVRPELQELITFRRINFIEPQWPINTFFDIIFCRNVMIYFDEVTQDRLLTRFADQLVPRGHLFIGHSESILRLDQVYTSLGTTVYRLNPGVGAAVRKDSEAAHGTATSPVQEKQSEKAKSKPAPSQRRRADKGVKSTVAKTTSDGESSANSDAKLPTHAIIVGEVKASDEPLRVTTLLGSCVAVCLYDPKTRVGGMNHFMLPCNHTADVQCATYGVHAMELLINEIMKLGGDRRRLTAKIFGGGDVLGKRITDNPGMTIGEQNIQFALGFLEKDRIPVIAKDLGGMTGRQIQFLTHTGQAFMRPVQKIEEDFEQEVLHMKRRARSSASEDSQVVLFLN